MKKAKFEEFKKDMMSILAEETKKAYETGFKDGYKKGKKEGDDLVFKIIGEIEEGQDKLDIFNL